MGRVKLKSNSFPASAEAGRAMMMLETATKQQQHNIPNYASAAANVLLPVHQGWLASAQCHPAAAVYNIKS
jgi:hypothetical protein